MGAYIGGGASGGAFGWSMRSPLAAWPAEVSLASSLVASRAGALTGFPAPAADIATRGSEGVTLREANRFVCLDVVRVVQGTRLQRRLEHSYDMIAVALCNR